MFKPCLRPKGGEEAWQILRDPFGLESLREMLGESVNIVGANELLIAHLCFV